MKKSDTRYVNFVNILKEELIPAMGCTEPIAIAFAAAKARDVLGVDYHEITKAVLQASGSIIKNVKSVVVPNTGKLKGLDTAICAGLVAGKPEKELEVIAEASPEQIDEMRRLLKELPITIEHVETGCVFDFNILLEAKDGYSKIRIRDDHTNIVLLEKNGEVLFELNEKENKKTDHSALTFESIWDFIQTVDIEEIKPVLSLQIANNMSIAEEGLRGNYGSSIGKLLLQNNANADVRTRAKAKAAAGSDARMNGCELPVVINSGSGNQGITCSVPVVEYANELNAGEEKTYRALALSNLISIHQKDGIGTLSAYCGAVSAGAGAAAGIVYLHGGDLEAVKSTVVNTLVTVSGMVCDGAKASCAAKIAMALDSAFLGYDMYLAGNSFQSGDGIVMEDIEDTIQAVGIIGSDGMKETNDEIIKLMIGK